MRDGKDINVCLDKLLSLQRRNNITSEQKKYVENALQVLRKLRRKSHPKRSEIHRAVREICEALIRAFVEL